ncbi:MAG: DUF1997 domain-containing protein [Cyanobacteria bacterium P01_C01_bin.38]
MVSINRECKSDKKRETIISVASTISDAQDLPLDVDLQEETKFYGTFSDCMKLFASAPTVAEYLNNHSEWFSRCAQPMKVEPLGENGYEIIIGRFGAFNYEVEPKIGLELLPPQEGIYRIRTIPIPDYQPPGYDVDYRASLQLVEENTSAETPVTRVEWELYLNVYVEFPNFIKRLPQSLIQKTGDRLLNQIVRQVSRRLTRKVQNDFHQSLGIPFSHNSTKA